MVTVTRLTEGRTLIVTAAVLPPTVPPMTAVPIRSAVNTPDWERLAMVASARLQVPGGDAFALYLLVSSSLPITLFLVPLFFMWNPLVLIHNLFGLIIILWATASTFATFLLHSYIVAVSPHC